MRETECTSRQYMWIGENVLRISRSTGLDIRFLTLHFPFEEYELPIQQNRGLYPKAEFHIRDLRSITDFDDVIQAIVLNQEIDGWSKSKVEDILSSLGYIGDDEDSRHSAACGVCNGALKLSEFNCRSCGCSRPLGSVVSNIIQRLTSLETLHDID